MCRGKRKHRLVKGKQPLEGVRPALQERVRGESTWSIVPQRKIPARPVASWAKESLPPQVGPYPELPRPTGLTGHTPSTHTPSMLSPALSLP